MRRRAAIAIGVTCAWAAALAMLEGCPQRSCGTAVTTVTPPTYLNDPWDGGAARGHFFHLSEGSEIFPYSWLLALNTDVDAAFFDTSSPPYGLLQDPPDPDCDADTCNRYGQPVGMTVAKTRDLAWLGLEMFGFNCAACHVGELTAQGKTFRVIGGPNMFDIIGFLTAFKASIAYTVGSVDPFMKFVARVAERALGANGDPSLDRRLQFAKRASSLAGLQDASPASKALTGAVQEAFADFKARHPAKPANKGPRPPGGGTRWVPLGPGQKERMAPHVAALTDKLSQAVSQQDAADARAYLSDFGEILALLLQRLDDIERILHGADGGVPLTAPGPGRVDAFMMTHNSLFTTEPPAPMTSPVDYPRIWGILAMHWFHWDGNTNSFLERNVGQALGLGGIVDPATGQSTIPILDIQELEALATAIPKPAWPFGIDGGLAEGGAVVFRTQCPSCHSADAEGAVMPVGAIDTDPLREQNFAMNMAADGSFDGAPFAYALKAELDLVVGQALENADASASGPDLDASWRVTHGYAQRPLDGVWATAPYLHNGSVATIDDLLTAPQSRPRSYMGGSRAYDTARMGYEANGTFLFDAGALGNAATGHAYGVDASADDKAALKEYLKTL